MMRQWSRVAGVWALAMGAIASGAQTQPPAVVTGTVFSHTVARGESLTRIGARFGVEPFVLARTNGLDGRAVLQPGQVLTVDARHIVPQGPDASIVINLPQRMLFHFDDEGTVSAYPVAVGQPATPTFVGRFVVTGVVARPVWIVPESIRREAEREGRTLPERVPPGPANPLGHYWIGLDRPGFGIHGTNAPSSIFRLATHGCIRLHPDDIATLVQQVARGIVGEVVYEPVLMARLDSGAVLLEAHPDRYRRQRDARTVVLEMARRMSVVDSIAWPAVDRVIKERTGVPTDVSRQP